MELLNLYLFHRNDRVRRIKRNSQTVIQHRRWRLVTLLEQFSVFWPHQSKLQQYPLQLFHTFSILTVSFAVANKLPEYVGVDNNMTIECCLVMLFCFSPFIKLIFASRHQHSRRKVYERIAKHFEKMSDPEELAVLNEGAEQAFKYSLSYMCIILVAIAIFDGIPILRAFYDYLSNNHELRMVLPIPMNYGFDHHEYWYIIVIDFIVWICSAFLVEFTYDLSFMLQIRHAVDLFKIVSIRLKKASELVNKSENGIMCDEDARESYSIISSAIDLHSECFELVKLIEKSYSTCWSIVLLLSTGGFGGGVHVVSTKIHDPFETYRYASVFMIVLMHFQMVFSHGQVIIDSSSGVLDACCECKWYGLPKKSRKLLSMMMTRTSIPCQITGAKLFPLSMESFSKMLKAGLSYYTVFERSANEVRFDVKTFVSVDHNESWTG